MIDSSGASKNNNSFRSVLHSEHAGLGVEMRNVGSYEVPFHYFSEIAGHNAVREVVGVFDLSLMDIIRVIGEDVAVLPAHSLISAIKPLALGRTKYTMTAQEDGGRVRRPLYHG